MNLILSLSPEIEAKLLEQSALTGEMPEELAVRAIEDRFLAAPQPPEALSAEEWVADVRA